MLNKMGLCQSIALKATVIDSEGQKNVYKISMKKMKTFKTLGDVFNFLGIQLEATDRIFYQNHVKLVEVYTYSPFQIRDFVIKPKNRDIKYRIMMDAKY